MPGRVKSAKPQALLEIGVHLVRKVVSEAPLAQIDYVELVDAETLQPLDKVRPSSLLALAVVFGKTRLIDNIRLG